MPGSSAAVDLILVRHGEASAAAAGDDQRRLTPGGRRDVEAVARAILRGKAPVRLILHSPKRRAVETAQILTDVLRPAEETRESEGLLPEDDPAAARRLAEESAQGLALVGHMPHLGQLASILLTGKGDRGLVSFGTATAAGLSRGEGKWILRWVLTPEAGRE